MKRFVSTITVLAILTLGTNSYAGQCDEIIKDCDTVIADQTTQITNYQKQSDLQKRVIEDKQHQLDSPLHDTMKVAVGTAVLLTILELSLGAFKR